MMCKWLVGASLSVACLGAWAAPGDIVKRSDGLQVLHKMNQSACEVLRIPYQSILKTASADSQPLTRSEIINFYYDLYTKTKIKFRFQPVLGKAEPAKFSLTGTDKTRAVELVQWGFVAPVGPVVASKTPTITVQQFGDSVGFFLCRLAELTHKPSARFSPQLAGGNAPAPAGSDKSKKPRKSG